MPPKNRSADERSELMRIAIVNPDRCKPKKCSLECKKCCPVNLQGKLCIEVTAAQPICKISEELCIGCGLCVKKCPFDAIRIINLPSNLDKDTIHRYGQNGFKLHRLPLPRPGQVLGLVGANGIGKSTALNILRGDKPNLGKYDEPNTWNDVIKYFRGSEHQSYFQKLQEKTMKTLSKPQHVDSIPKLVSGTVSELLKAKDTKDKLDYFLDFFDLKNLTDRKISDLSGGELQRFALALICIQDASVYFFDEPTSYLDVRQRLTAANAIRSLLKDDNYVVVVEHDLSIVDYISDFVCVLYGVPGIYGVTTLPYGVREGINIFLEGFIPTENLRFREEGLSFRIADDIEEVTKRHSDTSYPKMSKKMGSFTLNIEPGSFSDSEIIVLMGENGCGKTTFIRMLAGKLRPDDGGEVPELRVSFKPQKISPTFDGTVLELLQTKIYESFSHPQFQANVLKPLTIEELLDRPVKELSGGQLQRVGICLALGHPAKIFLIDEPSAYLDSDQRIIAARVIKRFIFASKSTAFVVEHDFVMATYLADRVIVYDGTPAVNCTANSPCSLMEGMNKFLKNLEITFRRDPDNFRPRINKLDSVKDREQKSIGQYFYMTETIEEAKEKKARKDAKAKEAEEQKKRESADSKGGRK